MSWSFAATGDARDGWKCRCAHGQTQELPSVDQTYALTKLLNLEPSR